MQQKYEFLGPWKWRKSLFVSNEKKSPPLKGNEKETTEVRSLWPVFRSSSSKSSTKAARLRRLSSHLDTLLLRTSLAEFEQCHHHPWHCPPISSNQYGFLNVAFMIVCLRVVSCHAAQYCRSGVGNLAGNTSTRSWRLREDKAPENCYEF